MRYTPGADGATLAKRKIAARPAASEPVGAFSRSISGSEEFFVFFPKFARRIDVFVDAVHREKIVSGQVLRTLLTEVAPVTIMPASTSDTNGAQ